MNRILIAIFLACPSILLSQGLVMKYQEIYTDNQYPYWGPSFDTHQGQGYYPFDLDDDGSIDIMRYNRYTHETTLYRMPGMIPVWTTAELSFGSVGLYDLTGDGSKEIVFFNYNPTYIIRIYDLLNEQYIASIDTFVGLGTNWMVSDFDNDGIDDIFFTLSNDGGVTSRLECWGVGQVMSSPPSSLTIAPEENNITLHWQSVDSCSMYIVEWSPNLSGDFAEIGRTCFTNFAHQGAALINRAYYRVRAITSTNGAIVVGTSTYSSKPKSDDVH